MIKWLRHAAGVLLLAMASMASADNTIKIVVPFPPGGTVDLLGRYASKLLNESGINTIVLNRPGAQGSVGLTSTLAADNRTLIIAGVGSGIISPILQNLNIDLARDFEPVAGLATIYPVIIVPAKSNITDVKTLVSMLKTREKSLTFGYGVSLHGMEGLRMLDAIGAKAVEVTYNGTSPLVVATAAGEIDFAITAYDPSVKEMADAGRIRMIAAFSKRRVQALPNLPTLIESGINVEAQSSWQVLLAKKGVDPKLVADINRIISDGLRRDRNQIMFDFIDALPATPGQVRDMIVTSQQIVARHLPQFKKP